MSKDMLLVVDAVSNEKGVSKEVIFGAIEAALASATKKRHAEDIEVRVVIDRETGEYNTYRCWEVVEENSESVEDDEEEGGYCFPSRQILLEEARKINSDIQLGEFTEEPMDSVEFGRIGAQAAKPVIVQKVREAERAQVVEAYQDRIGELVTGIVKRVERGNVYLDLGGNAEAIIYREEMILREAVRPGDRSEERRVGKECRSRWSPSH